MKLTGFILKVFSIVLLLICATIICSAQDSTLFKTKYDSTVVYKIFLKKGAAITGKIIDKQLENLTVRLDEHRKMTVPFIIISKIEMTAVYSTLSEKKDTSVTYRITMKDGSIFIGRILEKSSDEIIFKTKNINQFSIPLKEISKIEKIEDQHYKKGEYWFPNPNPSRYLFAPSAYNLKKGEGYYQNNYLVVNSFNLGITDHISFGGGLEFISTFSSLSSESDASPIFFLTPKVGFKIKEKLHLGGGIMFVNVMREGNAGIIYGISTFGSTDNNVTTGLGWGFINGTFSQKPIITVCGMKRIARKTALITENWIIPVDGYYGIFSYGVRFFGEKLSVDLAFINNPDIASFLIIGIPSVDFVVKF